MALKKQIDSKVVSLLFISVAVIGAVVVFVIIPLIIQDRSLGKEMIPLESKVRVQAELFPLYVELKNALEEYDYVDTSTVKPQGMGDVAIISSQFKQIATKNGIGYKMGTPDIDHIRGVRHLVLSVDLKGPYTGCWGFLNTVVKLPYITGTEAIRVVQEEGISKCTVRLFIVGES